MSITNFFTAIMLSSNRDTRADNVSLGMPADIMSLNGLKYRIPQPISSGVSRSYKKEYAQKSSYIQNQVMVFDWNTGTTYVNPDTAKLSFEYNHVLGAIAAGGNGKFVFCGSLGAASLIAEIRVISKNGIELDRISDAAVLSKIFVDYATTSEQRGELEMASGFGKSASNFLLNLAGANKIVDGDRTLLQTLKVVIPLKYLSGFFRPVIRDMLIPAGLASGLRIEFSLISDITHGVQTNGSVPISFTVSNPVILLETTEMNDPTQSALMKESAANGLEYTFPSYYSTKLSVGINGTLATQVNKAVSQATRLFLILQNDFIAPEGEVLVDSLASVDISDYTRYHFRVGQSYFPYLAVDVSSEKMGYALSTFSGWKDFNTGTSVDYDGYSTGGKAVVGTSLETTDRLNLSGLMLNNSSTGEVRFTVGDLGGRAGLRGVFFLEFVAVVKTSLNKSSLRI